jgi:hypothetical protein
LALFQVVMVKVPMLIAVRPGMVVPIVPVFAAVGTAAISCVSESTDLKLTE